MLYQVDRTNNQVVAYTVDANGTTTVVGTSAGGNFTNGRGITYSNGRLVVADDVDDDNAFYVYNASADGSSITLVNSYEVDINLWGLQAVGETLYAVSDNTNMIAVYNNFFNNDDGDVDADAMITVESLVRTHGIFYDASSDLMLLTDVGMGSVDDDGAFVVVNDFTSAAADNLLSDDEQIRVEGMGTFLGNPVDVAYDPGSMSIYIAERANGGGRILAFNMPTMDGSMAPYYNDDSFDGASSVWFANCDTGGSNNGGGNGTCTADAGMATVNMTSIDLDSTGTATITATADGNQVVPMGYETAFVLTMGSDLVIMDFNTSGTFTVDMAGDYAVHVLVAELDDTDSPDFVDLSVVMPGMTTGSDVLDLLDNNNICAALQVPGTAVTVGDGNNGGGGGTGNCTADAGMATVSATSVDIDSTGMATIMAMADGNQVVPMGYETAFVLTSGTNLVIEDFNTTGTFTVDAAGDYAVHVLVAELDDTDSPDFVDLSVITPGTTTGAEVLTLFGDANICAALQVPGTAVTVTDSGGNGNGGGGSCTAAAGMAMVDMTSVDLDSTGMATITATADGNQTVPMGFETAFVLTMGTDLVIQDFNTTGTFMVSMAGDYQVHVLVAELDDMDSPDFLDLSVITPGTTTGADALNLFASSGICAALQVPGTAVTVSNGNNGGGGGGGACTAAAGMAMVDATSVDLDSTGMATITAMADGNQTVPMGFETAFVLTMGTDLTIMDFNTNGTFTVNTAGDYQVHVLVAELDDMSSPDFLDLSIVMPGMTTGADVLNLLANSGICAALQVPGTAVTVSDPNNGGGGGGGACTAAAGMAMVDAATVVLDSTGTGMITAMADGNQTVPMGFETAFVLTMGTDLTIMDFNTSGTFTVSMAGDYQVHVLVAELDDTSSPDYLDLSIVTPGTTTGVDVVNLLGSSGICAALQVPGTAVTVEENGNIIATNDDPLAGFVQVAVFPNPTADYVTVTLETTDLRTDRTVFRLLNANGQAVRIRRSGDATDLRSFQFDLTDLPGGTYYLQTVRGKAVDTQTITKL